MNARCTIFLALLLACHPVSDGGAQEVERVDVGGHALEVSVSGSGVPTVVFESGLGNDLTIWADLQASVSEFTTAVTYSRAGYAGSDPGPTPRSPRQVNSELRTLLHELDLSPPYVLVGHSIGGLYNRAYYYEYPDEVAGLVLIDGSHERQFEAWREVRPDFDPWATYAPGGAAAEARAEMDEGPRGELDAFLDLQRAAALPVNGTLAGIPVYLLTAGMRPGANATFPLDAEGQRVWHALHRDLFSETTAGAHIVTRNSNHYIQMSEPELVAWSVRQVVESVRGEGN